MSGYWEKRAERRLNALERDAAKANKELIASFEKAQRKIQAEIEVFWARYAKDNNISYAEAQQLLNLEEMKEFRGTLAEFRKMSIDSIGTFNLEVANLSKQVRITRLQALETQIKAQLDTLYQQQHQTLTESATSVYYDQYFRNLFDVDQFTGFHHNFAVPNADAVKELIKYPFNGLNYSERLWRQQSSLSSRLKESVTNMVLQGKNPYEYRRELAKEFERSEFEAYRLLYTENAYVAGQADLDAYTESGFEEYENKAVFDTKTSKMCQEQDGKKYPVKDAKVGENYPPFHPFCRTKAVPVVEGAVLKNGTKIGRDANGKNIKIPADMSYKEYKAKYIDKKGEELADAKTIGMRHYAIAVKNEPQITFKVNSIADDVGMSMTGLEYRLKTKDSFLGKIEREFKPGYEFEIKDIIRYTMIATSDELASKTMAAIDKLDQEGYNVVVIKNSWGNKYNPYKGINTFVKSPNGQMFEIQYHTIESFNLKNNELHVLYEKQRVLKDKTSVEYIELSEKMFELSSKLKIPNGIERVKSK